jgi:hypothetical protein
MLGMLQAHGLDAGPTQRPLLAGAIAGFVASAPALAVVVPFGLLDALVRATRTSSLLAPIAYGILMLLGGVLYGWVFRRAANDVRGGWLFGMAFGFVLWMLGPIPLLQWLPAEPILRGDPAAGLLLGQLVWGLTLGVTFPFVHRRLHVRLGDLGGADGRAGPEAVVLRKALRSIPPSQSTPA